MLYRPLFAEVYDTVGAKLSEEGQSCDILTFGSYHIIHIVFKKIEGLICSALYLELGESHGNVFVPYIIGGDMCAEVLYIKNSPANAGTFIEALYFGVLLIETVRGISGIRVLFNMVSVIYLLQTDSPVMFGTIDTARVTAGVDEYLALILIGYLFKHIEFIVKVIVNNDYMIILFNFGIKRVGVGYTLAGGACQLVFGILFSYILLKYRRKNDSLVKSVVGNVHHHIAEIIAEMFFLDHRICKSESERDAPVIESTENSFDIILVTVAAAEPAAVPEGGWETSVYRSYLHAITEILRTSF